MSDSAFSVPGAALEFESYGTKNLRCSAAERVTGWRGDGELTDRTNGERTVQGDNFLTRAANGDDETLRAER